MASTPPSCLQVPPSWLACRPEADLGRYEEGRARGHCHGTAVVCLACEPKVGKHEAAQALRVAPEQDVGRLRVQPVATQRAKRESHRKSKYSVNLCRRSSTSSPPFFPHKELLVGGGARRGDAGPNAEADLDVTVDHVSFVEVLKGK